MKKALLCIVMLGALVTAGGAWWVNRPLDYRAASAIRNYGPEIAGVSVKLSSLKIVPAGGGAILRYLTLGNPKGFQSDRALSLGEISMVIDAGSLTTDVIVIRKLTITGAEVNYEYGAQGSNLDTIQRNIDRYVAEHHPSKESAVTSGPAKRLIIDDFFIVGGKVAVSAATLQGKPVTVDLPTVNLRGMGRTHGGATVGEIVQQIMGGLNYNAARAARPLNPDTNALKNRAGTAGDKVKGLLE